MSNSTQKYQQTTTKRAERKAIHTSPTSPTMPLKITTPTPLSLATIAAAAAAAQTALYVHDPYGSGDMMCVGSAARWSLRARSEFIDDDFTADVERAASTSSAASTPGHSWAGSSSATSVTEEVPVLTASEVEAALSNEQTARKRRQRKSRKNRSAGLAGENGQRVSVCLDHLKGVCNKKRSRCKYAHPQLSLDAPAPIPQQIAIAAPAQVRVCEVWALTGFCKFGAYCRDYHPAVEEPITKVCAPATTMRMSKTSRQAAMKAKKGSTQSVSSDSDDTPPPTPLSADARESGTRGAMQWWYEVDGLLVGLSHANFDDTLKRLVGILCSTEGLRIETLLPVLFGKAIENFERLAALLASLCRHLCDLYPEAQRHEFQGQLLRLADRVFYLTPEGLNFAEWTSVHRKQRGTANFIGELFKLSLVPPVRLQCVLDYCIKRGSAPTEDGNLFVELASTILRVVGPSVARVLDLERTVKQLNERVGMHQTRRAGMDAAPFSHQPYSVPMVSRPY